MIEVFKKEYDGESIVDLGRDIYEALVTAFNPVIDLIPVDDYGFQKGTFTVAVVWSGEPEPCQECGGDGAGGEHEEDCAMIQGRDYQ